MQWAQLKKLRTNERIIERLGKLPESLTEAYDEIYSKNYEKAVLKRAVKWVLCAAEPLTSEVLLMAVRLESNLVSLTLSDPIDESTLEDICSHLVVLDSQLKVWKFPHASVAEYFEDRHKGWIDKAPEDVAILLVSCLIECYSIWTPPASRNELQKFFQITPEAGNHLDPRHPLQKYTRKYWQQHLQNTPNQYQEATGLPEILKRFLGAQGPQGLSSRQYQAWCEHMRIGFYPLSYGYHKDIQPSEKSIFGICALGFHKLLNGWWNKDVNVSQVNKPGLDLLAIAAKYGHDELCSELIDQGSDVNRELDSGYGSALMEAIPEKQHKTVRLLLDRGANPNLIRQGASPLCLAVRYAEDLVESLLKAGADPNIKCPDCTFDCALQVAAWTNRTHAAELLIKAGANVNLVTGKNIYGSLLGTAAYGGSLKCVKLFVEKGANVNAHLGGNYGSVLAAVIFGLGEVDAMVSWLIEEAGADPAILSSSPPSWWAWIDSEKRDNRRKVARYLIEGGHVQESVLLGIGFPRTDLPGMEGEVTTESEDEDTWAY